MVVKKNVRCQANTSEGIACGPVSITAVVAEMEIEDEGVKKFITCSWIAECHESAQIAIVSDSIYDTLLFFDDEVDRLNALTEEEGAYNEILETKSYDGPYVEEVEELIQVLKDTIVSEGIYDPSATVYDDEEDIPEGDGWEF